MGDRELAVANTSKCEEEKVKGENGKKAAINLTRESHKVKVTEKDRVVLVDKSHKIFANLERRNIIPEKDKNDFSRESYQC